MLSLTSPFVKFYFTKKLQNIKKGILTNLALKKRFYTKENGKLVDLSKLAVGRVPLEKYKHGHAGLEFGCHDVLLEYKGGLLLIVRDNLPAKDVLWPIGGRVQRGVPSEKSLENKIKEECGLGISGDLIFLGEGRTAFQTDPFGHGHGTDTTNERYFAKANGEIKLDNLHKEPTIIKPSDYNPDFRAGLENYVKDFMDLAMLFVEGMNPVLHYHYLHEQVPFDSNAKYAEKFLKKQKII